MEKVLQIKVDKAILLDVENYAKKMNLSVSDLVSDYLRHISKCSSKNKINEVNTYHELVEALDAGMEDINQGRFYSHIEMKEYWEKKMGQNARI